LRKLDHLRARFETAAAIFGEATRGLKDDLGNTRSRVAEREALATQLAGERDVLAAQLAVERGSTARLGEERDALSAERDALSAERDKFAVQLSARRARAASF
jgi:hypothetical protein